MREASCFWIDERAAAGGPPFRAARGLGSPSRSSSCGGIRADPCVRRSGRALSRAGLGRSLSLRPLDGAPFSRRGPSPLRRAGPRHRRPPRSLRRACSTLCCSSGIRFTTSPRLRSPRLLGRGLDHVGLPRLDLAPDHRHQVVVVLIPVARRLPCVDHPSTTRSASLISFSVRRSLRGCRSARGPPREAAARERSAAAPASAPGRAPPPHPAAGARG